MVHGLFSSVQKHITPFYTHRADGYLLHLSLCSALYTLHFSLYSAPIHCTLYLYIPMTSASHKACYCGSYVHPHSSGQAWASQEAMCTYVKFKRTQGGTFNTHTLTRKHIKGLLCSNQLSFFFLIHHVIQGFFITCGSLHEPVQTNMTRSQQEVRLNVRTQHTFGL